MEEIRDTFESLGMTPDLFEGVAEMYRLIGSTPLGEEFPETRDRDRTFTETIRELASHVQSQEKNGGRTFVSPQSLDLKVHGSITRHERTFSLRTLNLERYDAGLKYGTLIWSVARSKVTSTGIPMVTSAGLHSTILVNIRTPSSSSTRART